LEIDHIYLHLQKMRAERKGHLTRIFFCIGMFCKLCTCTFQHFLCDWA